MKKILITTLASILFVSQPLLASSEVETSSPFVGLLKEAPKEFVFKADKLKKNFEGTITFELAGKQVAYAEMTTDEDEDEDDIIVLNTIEVNGQKGQGIGSKFIQKLISYYSETGKFVTMTLIADALDGPEYQESLEKFYETNGFSRDTSALFFAKYDINL